MKLHFKWGKNSKLKKLNTAGFNLPAFRSADGFETCPQAGICATYCYARQGRYVMAPIAAPREANLKSARFDPLFEAKLLEDLKQIREPIIRVHDSGDFFDQDYLDKWLRTAKACPEKKFYAYTKSLHLDFSLKPDNFQIVQSVGGKLDKKINRKKSHSRVFATHADRKKLGYVDGNKNDAPAIRGDIKIGLVYHGSKNLKPGQIIYLQKGI